MQITYKILKVNVYKKVLKDVTCNLRKVLNKSAKTIKKYLKYYTLFKNSDQPKTWKMNVEDASFECSYYGFSF